MDTKVPYPEDIEYLEQLIESGHWSKSWALKKLELNNNHNSLWLRLAQNIWKKAYPEKSKKKSSDSQHNESDKDNEEEYLYSAEEQIAQILMGLPNPCEKEPTIEDQRFFENAPIDTKEPGESLSVGRDLHLIYLKIIQKGNEYSDWDLCIPSYPVLISRPTPRIQIKNIHLLHEARNVRKCFSETLKENPNLLKKHLTASCLLSAMVWGGLIEEAALTALYNVLHMPITIGPGGIWIDIHIHPDKPMQSRIRRFFLDPITTSFWLTLPSTNIQTDSVENLINSLLDDLLNNEVISLKHLLEGLAQEVSNEIPEVLVHIATGQTQTHPIKENRWHNIQNILIPTTKISKSDETSTKHVIITDDDINNLELKEFENDPLLELILPQGMAGLRSAIRCKNKKLMRCKLRELLINESSHPPIINNLARWLINPPGHNRISTIRWMFGLIGSRLASLFGNQDPESCNLQELEEVYSAVLDDGKSASHRSGMRYSLLNFSSYLAGNEERKKISILRVQERIDVSSRIITQEEYIESLEQLSRPVPSNDNPEWITACQIILILLFRLGLRKQELLYLPLHDIHGNEFIEILIRPHAERNIKTANALRKLQLSGFLSNKEITIINKWLHKRRTQQINEPGSDYLFALPENDISLISADAIVNRIVEVIRDVTQDANFHIHHLRHSFATWAAMSIVGNIVEDDFTSWDHLPSTKSWLVRFPDFFDKLYTRESPQHNRIYLLSTLLGHSSPAISMEHYIHGLDQILGNAIWRFFSVEPKEIHPQCFYTTSRTYQRWATGGWPLIIERLSKNNPERCLTSSKTNISIKSLEISDQLFNHYYQIWETLKTINDSNLSIDDEHLSSRHKIEDIKKWFENSKELHKKGFINKTYPTLPPGDTRKTRIMEYANKLQSLAEKYNGQDTLITFLTLCKKYKVKGKGAVRFTNKNDALIYKECLLKIGIQWKQINFTWVGSRFNKSKEKSYKKEWRKELNIPKRIKILTKSINNDRPLDKTKGYMEIKIINNDDLDKLPLKSSTEFQWLVWMAMIEESEPGIFK